MRRIEVVGTIAWGLVCGAFVLPALLSTDTLTYWLAHPLRLGVFGEVPPSTTRGALMLQAAGLAMAALLALLPTALRRMLCRAAKVSSRPLPQIHMEPVSLREWLLLATFVLAGVILRMARLDESLWYDEIAAFLEFSVHGPGPAIGNYFTQSNHVLHSILAWASAEVLGASELSLRLPALLLGSAMVGAAWLLARECGLGAAGRLGSAVFAAAMPLSVLESTDARGYTAMALFASLGVALIVRGIRLASHWSLAWAAIILALGIWSHLVTASVCVAAIGVAGGLVIAGRRTPLAWYGTALGLTAVAAMLTAAVLLSPLLPDLVATRSEFLALDGDEPTLIGPETLPALLGIGGAWSAWALPGVVGAICGIVLSFRGPGLWAARLALAILFGAVVAAMLGTALGGSWLYARFLCFGIGATALALGLALECAKARRRWLGALFLLAIVIPWITLLGSLGPRQQLRQAVAWVAENSAPDETVVAVGLRNDVHAWYSGLLNVSMEGSGPMGCELTERLERLDPRHVLMLYPHACQPAVGDELAAAGYAPVKSFPGWMDWGRGEIVIYRRQ